MSNNDDSIELFPLHEKTSISVWLAYIFQAAILTNWAIRCVTHPSTYNTILFLGFLAILIIYYFARKPATPPCFYITSKRAGFGNHHRDSQAVPFEFVTLYHETPSGVSLIHESLSIPLGIDLKRHSLSVHDWETITATLVDRIRAQSPKAEIITILDPPRPES